MKKKTVLGACPHDCPDTCSMLVNVEDERVVSVRGNPEQPFTRGRLCVKVNNYQDRVYSDQRVLYPLRRSGPKGSGNFERISWDEAMREISSQWRKTIKDYGAKAILPYSYLGTQGILNGLNVGDPFFNKLGATILERSFCDSGASTAYAMTIGDSAAVDPESFVHSKFIILWACNTLSTNSHHWPFIEQARKNGARIVVIDPATSRTAKLADWHIRIRPGTDAALALAMINILITESLVDDDYVEKYTLGFEALKERVKEFTAERTSEITGIPAEEISELARAYGNTPPAVIRMGVAIERHAGGGQAVRAICCLPALIGSWRKVGGGVLQMPIWAFPVNWDRQMRPDFIGERPRVVNCWKLGQALAGEFKETDDVALNPPVKSLFVYNSNPVVMCPEQTKIIAGLSRDDLFTVVSDHFITDTARFADIILPATTQVEQEDIMFSWGHLYLSYNNQSISPLGESVSNTELFRRLARAMDYDDDFFYRTDAEMVSEAMDWSSPQLEGISLERLKKQGFCRLNLPDADHYTPHAEGNFKTASGKCEFESSLAKQGNFVLPLFRQGYEGQQLGDEVDPLPHYIPPKNSIHTNSDLASIYPLSLISPKSHAFLSSNYGNMPRQIQHEGEQSVMMHPVDAESRSLKDSMFVEITNQHGSFSALLRVTENTMPGVVIAPVGHWRSNSPNHKGEQGTVHNLLTSEFSDLGAAPTFSDVLVEVARI